MQKKIEGKIEWLEFELLKPFPKVKHAVFLRGDQFDLGEFGKVADQLRALRLLGLKCGVKLKQCHGDQVLLVKGATELLRAKGEGDGLITRQEGVGLMVRHADCQAAIFYDPVQHALAVVHCGWRGSTKDIYQKTVAMMAKQCGTKPCDVRVCIGPSLGPKACELKHDQSELPAFFWENQVTPNYFDFWAISTKQLIEAGVLRERIEIAKRCTYSSPSEYFSYRRKKGERARHATIAALL